MELRRFRFNPNFTYTHLLKPSIPSKYLVLIIYLLSQQMKEYNMNTQINLDRELSLSKAHSFMKY